MTSYSSVDGNEILVNDEYVAPEFLLFYEHASIVDELHRVFGSHKTIIFNDQVLAPRVPASFMFQLKDKHELDAPTYMHVKYISPNTFQEYQEYGKYGKYTKFGVRISIQEFQIYVFHIMKFTVLSRNK